MINVVAARHGNTARTGAQPRDENGRLADRPQGHDFYQLTLTVQTPCELIPICLWADQQFAIPFSGERYTLAAGGKASLSADASAAVASYGAPPQPYAGKGLLKCSVNGKIQYIQINGWKEIWPP